MYFNTQDILSLANCSKCNQTFDVPKCLPCSKRICQRCENNITKNSNNSDFKCSACNQIHNMPQEGLPIDFLAQSIFNLKPIKINRGDLHDKAQNAVGDLKSIHGDLKEHVDNCGNKIRTVCDLVRNQIEIATESKIEFLNKYKNEMIDEVDQYEQQCMQNVSKQKEQFNTDFIGFIETSDLQLEKWKNELLRPDIKDKEVASILDESKSFKIVLNTKQLEIEQASFFNKKISFLENENDLNSSHIGKIGYGTINPSIDIFCKEEPTTISYTLTGHFTTRNNNGDTIIATYETSRVYLRIYGMNGVKKMEKRIESNEMFFHELNAHTVHNACDCDYRDYQGVQINGLACVGGFIALACNTNKLLLLNSQLEIFDNLTIPNEPIWLLKTFNRELYVFSKLSPFKMSVYNERIDLVRSIRINMNNSVEKRNVAVSRDNIFCYDHGQISMFNSSDGSLTKTIQLDGAVFHAFAMLSSNNFILLKANDSKLKLYDLNGKFVQEIKLNASICEPMISLFDDATMIIDDPSSQMLYLYKNKL